MRRPGILIDKNTEIAVFELLKSRAEARIYIYLLKKNGARTEDIIKGTKLHPSTVRELLSKMYTQNLISREKIKNDTIGKNPYFYQATSPANLLQKRINELEHRLNKIANIGNNKPETETHIKINILKKTTEDT
jgi:predicted transcriptional regulator